MKIRDNAQSSNKKFKNQRFDSIIHINFIFLILFFIAIISIRNLYIYFLRNKTITVRNPIIYESIIDANALIIRDEYVYSKNKSIDFDMTDRIPVNFPLGSIKKYENDSGYENSNLSEKINAIKKIQDNYTEFNKKKEKIANTIFNLKDAVRNGSLIAANEIVKENQDNLNMNLMELEIFKRQFELIKAIQEKQGSNLVSLNPGVYRDNIDGFETIYNYSNKDRIHGLIYQSFPSNNTQKGFKIIDNSEISLRFHIITKELLNRYTNGSEIEFIINDERIIGNIEKINLFGDYTAFTVTIREKPEMFLDQRFIDIQLINYKTKVYKLPIKSMVLKNDQPGYYLRDSSGIVNFVPVDIVKEDKRNNYIKAGTSGEVLINGKQMKSLKEYDEIIKNPKFVKEGMIIE